MSEHISAVIYYDGPRSLEAMVQTHLASESPYLELYIQFSSPNDAFVTSTSTAVRKEYTTHVRDSVSGWQNTKTPVLGSSMEYTTPARHSAEVALFAEPEPVPTIPEDVEGGSDEEKEEDPRFRAYSPPAYMYNVDLSQDDAMEFPDIPHRRRDRTNVSQDHPKMDSDMLASLILPTMKADPKTSVSVLIANISSQLRYTPSYCKVWIAKQKALEKMHGKWDASYNEVWQWYQVLERYVSSCITDLETTPAYYNDRLLRGCQVFKRLFWSFKQCWDAFLYCKPLVQIDARIVVPPAGDLVMGVGRMTHLDIIMNVELFPSPMVEVIVWALLMGPRHHPFFLDLKGPVVLLDKNLLSLLLFRHHCVSMEEHQSTIINGLPPKFDHVVSIITTSRVSFDLQGFLAAVGVLILGVHRDHSAMFVARLAMWLVIATTVMILLMIHYHCSPHNDPPQLASCSLYSGSSIVIAGNGNSAPISHVAFEACMQVGAPTANEGSSISMSSMSNLKLTQWHQRLGHPISATLHNVLRSCNISVPHTNEFTSNCNACTLEKSHRLSFSSTTSVYFAPLDLVITDLWSLSRSVTLSLLNHRRPTATGHRDAANTVVFGDASMTPLRHPEPIRPLSIQSESITTQPVRFND
ncbi:hypothetical protein PVK06_048675 [Gossypium arboreum]|uniref:GAG-pre-integrase domain-containing protein n=1 Tax=Gossypium arboreum TaxID=29729 RepID=A0ABR0MH41_GOSAR|nr:hypothetical protein PVK06_048675 [Gossypium arboreum]